MAREPAAQLAARLHGPGDIRVEAEPRPEATPPGEVRLRVLSVGLCGSDLHWFSEGAIGDARLGHPLVLGHEIAAVVDEGPRRGTRVALDPADPCGSCAICTGGHEELCVTMRFAGHSTTDGGLRDTMTWPERLLRPIPDVIGDAEACLLETLGVAIHAVDVGEVRPGMRAAVVGCGPIGLLVIAALRVAGIDDVLATDLLDHRVAAARRAGADAWPAGPDGEGDGSGRRFEASADVVFECAGDAPAVEASVRLAAPAGRVVLVGIPGDDRTTFSASTARRKGLTLVVSRRMTAPDLDRAIELAATGRVDLAALVTDRFALAEAPQAFEALASRRGLKVVVSPGDRA